MNSMLEEMPGIVEQGKVPLSIYGGMFERLQDPRKLTQPIDSGDAIYYHSGRRVVKISLDDPTLMNLKPYDRFRLIHGGLPVESDVYEKIDGIEIKNSKLKEHIGKRQTLQEVLNNLFWRMFARYPGYVPDRFAKDPNVFKEYARLVFNQSNYNENMAVIPRPWEMIPEGIVIMRPLHLDYLEGGSDVLDEFSLDGDSNNLVAVAPEVSTPKPLDQRVKRIWNKFLQKIL